MLKKDHQHVPLCIWQYPGTIYHSEDPGKSVCLQPERRGIHPSNQPRAGSLADGSGQVRSTWQVQGLDIPAWHPPMDFLVPIVEGFERISELVETTSEPEQHLPVQAEQQVEVLFAMHVGKQVQ